MKDALSSDKTFIASFATSVPQYSADQSFAGEFMRKHFGGALSHRSRALLRAIFAHPGVRKRHFAFDDPSCLLSEGPDERIGRFTERSIELSCRAASMALEAAGLAAGDVAGIVVNTCTGYVCPGISTYLVERLGISRSVRAYDLVGSGCGGAVPNLQVAETMVRSMGRPALSVSVEICSATFQMDNDPGLILSNALFGDGAAAAVVRPCPPGWEMVASASRYALEHRDAIRYVHKNGQLRNQLSLRLPDLVKGTAADAVADALRAGGIERVDVRHWALHTGGEKIIDSLRDEIGIPEERLAAARRILAEYGNMSSPTVWFVLDEIERKGVEQGDWCVMAAYGAGLSAHAYLLRKT